MDRRFFIIERGGLQFHVERPIPENAMQLTHLPHEQRVIDEHKELNTRIEALERFVTGSNARGTGQFSTLPGKEQTRLRRQLEVMKEYLSILQERIDAFPLPDGLVRINIGAIAP